MGPKQTFWAALCFRLTKGTAGWELGLSYLVINVFFMKCKSRRDTRALPLGLSLITLSTGCFIFVIVCVSTYVNFTIATLFFYFNQHFKQ